MTSFFPCPYSHSQDLLIAIIHLKLYVCILSARMYCARFNNSSKQYIYPLSHSYLNFYCTNPLSLRPNYISRPRDLNGGHLLEMHVFWYDGCNCGSTKSINHYYEHKWDSAGVGLCEHAIFGLVKGHTKVMVKLKFHI